ncbi:MAG: hypothetical protein ACU83V_07595 [Gammaproteobacteria bacterium]
MKAIMCLFDGCRAGLLKIKRSLVVHGFKQLMWPLSKQDAITVNILPLNVSANTPFASLKILACFITSGKLYFPFFNLVCDQLSLLQLHLGAPKSRPDCEKSRP